MPVFRTLLTLFGVAVVLPAGAQTAGGGDSPWRTYVRGGAVHQFDSGLDQGGEYAVTRANIEAGLGYATGPRNSVGLAVGYTLDDYDFNGMTGLAGRDPWGEVHEYMISGSFRRGVGERIDIFALPFLRWSAEDGGDLGEAMTAGLIAGMNYRVSDRLRIGPGIGLFEQIEDSVTAFPILLIDWKITETLSLETGSGLAATRGPGLQLNFTAIDNWTFGLGARYENYRFRLDEDGVVPDGVGEEESTLVYLSAGYDVNPVMRVSALAGLKIGGELTLEDMDGRTIQSDDADPVPLVGLAFRTRF
jgi:outer membrane receptor protein involved in Fe transport